MFEIIMDNLFCLGIPLIFIIAFVRILFQKPSPPPIEQQSIDYQQKEINGLLETWSDIKDRFIEAKNDSATHAIYHLDVITFYRTADGEFEFRTLVFTPAPRWDWGGDWKNCDKIPHYAIEISDKL